MKTIIILFLLLPIFAFSQSKVEDIQTIKTANSTSSLIKITEPTGLELISEEGNDGWRLIGFNPNLYGTIGNQAVDLSINNNSKNTHGAMGDYSFACGDGNYASGDYAFASGSVTNASGTNSTATGKETVASGNGSFTQGEQTTAQNTYPILPLWGDVRRTEGLNNQ